MRASRTNWGGAINFAASGLRIHGAVPEVLVLSPDVFRSLKEEAFGREVGYVSSMICNDGTRLRIGLLPGEVGVAYVGGFTARGPASSFLTANEAWGPLPVRLSLPRDPALRTWARGWRS